MQISEVGCGRQSNFLQYIAGVYDEGSCLTMLSTSLNVYPLLVWNSSLQGW